MPGCGDTRRVPSSGAGALPGRTLVAARGRGVLRLRSWAELPQVRGTRRSGWRLRSEHGPASMREVWALDAVSCSCGLRSRPASCSHGPGGRNSVTERGGFSFLAVALPAWPARSLSGDHPEPRFLSPLVAQSLSGFLLTPSPFYRREDQGRERPPPSEGEPSGSTRRGVCSTGSVPQDREATTVLV